MCIKNKKRFLLWSYYGECKYSVAHFGKAILVSSQLLATFKCKMCGRTYTNYVSEDTLHKMGVSAEAIMKDRNKLFACA